MKKNNIARLNMFDGMILLFDANRALIARIPAFQSGSERFQRTVAELKLAAEEEKAQSGGVTEAKKLQKAAVAADVATLAGAAFSFANDNGRPELAGEMKYSERDLQRLKDQDFLFTGRRLLRGVRAELAHLADYAVTEAMLDDADAAITAYEKGAPAPRKVIVHRSDASDRVEELDAQANAILKLTLDKLVKQYSKTDPDFVNQYKKCASSSTPPLPAPHSPSTCLAPTRNPSPPRRCASKAPASRASPTPTASASSKTSSPARKRSPSPTAIIHRRPWKTYS
nr:hypothetical protein [Flaviaesturariibacter aridisoli]